MVGRCFWHTSCSIGCERMSPIGYLFYPEEIPITKIKYHLELNMIIYYRKDSRVGPRIQMAVEEIFPKNMVAVCNSLEDAIALPAFPPSSHDIVLLLAEDRNELLGFSKHRSHLLDRKLILILPNMEVETLSEGCLYHPRFITDMRGDLTDMQKVITKMTQYEKCIDPSKINSGNK